MSQGNQALRQEMSQEIEAFRQETSQENQVLRQEMSQEIQAFRQEVSQENQAFRHEVTHENQTLRQETMERFDHQGIFLQKQINALSDQIAANEERDAKFRSDVMGMVDLVVRKYELFEQEKSALGAGQDRLQREIALIHESDHRQNQAIHELDGRVSQLESTRLQR
jgi:hypothetical protein